MVGSRVFPPGSARRVEPSPCKERAFVMSTRHQYDRFVDLHIMHEGHYDFVADVRSQLAYQKKQHKFQKAHNLTKWGDGKYQSLDNSLDLQFSLDNSLSEDDGTLDRGYVAVAVELKDIETAKRQRGTSQLLAWVGDTRRQGKLRINVHGDGEGNIGMFNGPSEPRSYLSVQADKIADWLHANGLPTPVRYSNTDVGHGNPATPRPTEWSVQGLNHVSLALCMGARSGSAFALLEHGNDHADPALGSAIDRCVGGLKKHKLTNITVTGTNEIVYNLDGKIGRLLLLPSGWTVQDIIPGVSQKKDPEKQPPIPPPFSPFKQLHIPTELSVNETDGLISIPADGFTVVPYAITGFAADGSQIKQTGWLVSDDKKPLYFIPSRGWYVDGLPGFGWIIQPPVGFVPTVDARGNGTILFEVKDAEHIGNTPLGLTVVWQRLGHSAEKSQESS